MRYLSSTYPICDRSSALMQLMRPIAILLILLLFSTPSPAQGTSESLFTVIPYVQLGEQAKASERTKEEVHWFSVSDKTDWQVGVKQADDKKWTKVPSTVHRFAVPSSGTAGLQHYWCAIDGLRPGETFGYRVCDGDTVLFESHSVAPKSAAQKYRVAIFGDGGAGTDGQKKVAYQCFENHPDLLVIPGDISYPEGLFSDYMQRFFPIYNADKATATQGAPIMRSVPIVPVLGNHDIAFTAHAINTDLSRMPDALAYFYVWSVPHNGPLKNVGDDFSPKISGAEPAKINFLKSAGDNYPVAADYSFDYGNAHWLVLDGNFYTDWSNQKMRDWVQKDLASAKNATWKFVTFHQPGFSADKKHGNEQRMRLLSDIFEKEGVDVVWAGHAHNYQRTFPLTFKAQSKDGIPFMNLDGTVPGDFGFDKNYDGKSDKTPKGIIYIVTGAGGQTLYESSQADLDGFKFLDKFEGNTHSFTICDIDGAQMKVRQISEDGKIVDEFALNKMTANLVAPKKREPATR